MMTKLLAKADLSLSRCWEGHVNSLVLIDALGTPEQRRRWFGGVVERGEIWVIWSGEPRAPKPGELHRYGTTVTPTEGGWIINGTKAFATSATGATWAVLMVNLAGPGGARHADGPADELLMLACDLSDPTITVDTSWWDPIGMRATASHLMQFDQTFVSRDCLIGQPGSFLRERWQTAFVPHYAASFLGAAEAVYEYGLSYIKHQGKATDPYIQQRVGTMAVNVESSHLWLHHVVITTTTFSPRLAARYSASSTTSRFIDSDSFQSGTGPRYRYSMNRRPNRPAANITSPAMMEVIGRVATSAAHPATPRILRARGQRRCSAGWV